MSNVPDVQEEEFSRELSLGALFSKSWRVARKYYLKTLPAFLVLGIVSAIISGAITAATPSANFPTSLTGLSSSQIVAIARPVFVYIGYQVLNYFVEFCLLYFAVGIGISKMNAALHSLSTRTTPSTDASVSTNPSPVPTNNVLPTNYASLAIATVLSVVVIFAGSILIFVGALILATMLYLTLAAVAIEGKSPVSAMGRSRQLVSGRWLKTFALMIGIFLLVELVSSLVGDLVSLAFTGTAATIVSDAAFNIALALTLPLVSASMLVLYYSSRAREVQQLTPPRPPPSPYDNMKPEPMGYFGAARTGDQAPNNNNKEYCYACGSKVSPDEKFCHNCGAHLS